MSSILHILNFLLVLLEVVVLFNLIIIAHEWGHFLAARWRGLKIEEFGVWFGKPIWKKTINGVVYSLGTIPFGGFVKLPQLAPMEMIEGESDVPREALPPISPLDKIIVAFAGPLFSFLLAIVLACAVWAVGKPIHESEKSSVIGFVKAGSPAEKAGLMPGDIIEEVDGHKVRGFSGMTKSVTWYVARSEGDTISFKIERDGKEHVIQSGWVVQPRKGWKRAGLREVQIGPATTAKIDDVIPNSPAADAKLAKGDIVTHVNGKKIFDVIEVAKIIEEHPKEPVNLTIKRDSQWLNYTIAPKPLLDDEGKSRNLIGIKWHLLDRIYPTPFEQIADSVDGIKNMLEALFSPKSGIKAEHMSGPVGILSIYFQMLLSPEGWRWALAFSVFLNVNLALLNLLPFPVLDGGHIVLAVIEGVRRKPVNIKALEILQTACALLLIGFMLYVTFFDVQDLPWKKWFRGRETPELKAK